MYANKKILFRKHKQIDVFIYRFDKYVNKSATMKQLPPINIKSLSSAALSSALSPSETALTSC